jgi:hypothetical protein
MDHGGLVFGFDFGICDRETGWILDEAKEFRSPSLSEAQWGRTKQYCEDDQFISDVYDHSFASTTVLG